MIPRFSLSLLFPLLLLAGCDLFSPRAPETPVGDRGTWLQPDTPERVIENMRNAVAELNAQNYVRSLYDGFAFEPAPGAVSRDPLVWATWGRAEEQTYFGRLKAFAELFSGHNLQLLDLTPSVVSDDRYVLNATYVLTVRHSRVNEGIPETAQGTLVWDMRQDDGGLWRLYGWTDREIGGNPSWSDIKAAFIR